MAGVGGTGYFWIRRLHSVAGILFSVAYVALFLLPMSAAFEGAASFNGTAAWLARLPLMGPILVLFVFAPLLFHAAVGLAMLYSSSFNVISYGFYRNWMYALQRLTGVLILPFAAYHISKTVLAFAFTGKVADFAFMQGLLAPSWVKALYCVGVVCAAFHIGNGLAGALARFGLTGSRRSQDAASMAAWVLTLVLALWGLRIVFTF